MRENGRDSVTPLSLDVNLSSRHRREKPWPANRVYGLCTKQYGFSTNGAKTPADLSQITQGFADHCWLRGRSLVLGADRRVESTLNPRCPEYS